MGALAQHHGENDFFKNQRDYAENQHHQKHTKSHCNKDKKSGDYQHKKQAKMEHRIEKKVSKMSKRLDLSPKQQQELTQLLNKNYEQKRALRKEFKQEVKNLLTPEQRQKFKHHKRT